VFDGGDGFFLAAEDGAAAGAGALAGVVDLFPEAYEVVGGRDDGDDGHPVDGGDGDEVDADDVAAVEAGEPEPVVPAVGEDGSDDGDDLDDGLELADLAGFDGEALGGGDGAEAGDEELAADDEHGDPGRDDAGVVGDQDDVGGGDQELVGEGVEEHADGGDLLASAGEIAVEAVGDAGEDEDGGGDELLLATAKADGSVPAGERERRREHPDEKGYTGDAAHRDGVGQIHRLLWLDSKAARHCMVVPSGNSASLGVQSQSMEPPVIEPSRNLRDSRAYLVCSLNGERPDDYVVRTLCDLLSAHPGCVATRPRRDGHSAAEYVLWLDWDRMGGDADLGPGLASSLCCGCGADVLSPSGMALEHRRQRSS
jgi:hypothetical protein